MDFYEIFLDFLPLLTLMPYFFQDFYKRFNFENLLKFSLSVSPPKNGVNFPKTTLTPFNVSNFAWKTDKLKFKTFCRKKKFEQILKKVEIWG